MSDKFTESFEKNFDSTLKSINKFKDDLKHRPTLSILTETRLTLYLDLLLAELDEIRTKFVGETQEVQELKKYIDVDS